MHAVFALLCFVVVIHWLIFPYPSGLLHWHCGNLTIAPVPAKQPWWIWINTSCEFIMNDCVTTTKQSTTKPCAYFLGYTVRWRIFSHTLAHLSHCTLAHPWHKFTSNCCSAGTERYIYYHDNSLYIHILTPTHSVQMESVVKGRHYTPATRRFFRRLLDALTCWMCTKFRPSVFCCYDCYALCNTV